MSRTQVKWQKSFLMKIFDRNASHQEFSDRILDDLPLLNIKNSYMPDSLFKFYSATSDNILDLKNQRLWLSHPSTFNDPYDCRIGYNETEYEKLQLLNAIKTNGLLGDSGNSIITAAEYKEISDSCVNGEEYFRWSNKKGYTSVIYNIMKDKTEKFQRLIFKMEYDIRNNAKQKIENISQTNVRVTCFTAQKPHSVYYSSSYNDECLSKIQMWSHYADNHKGFCVEYDISPLKKDLMLNYNIGHFYSETVKEKYMDERMNVIIKGGLFPVIYTSKRVNLPYRKLKEYKIGEQDKVMRILYNAYITKSTFWSYENEWRLIIGDKVSNYYTNKIPFPFIKAIYLGCKMEQSNIDEILNIANDIGAETKIMQMENDKFDLFGLSTKWYNLDSDRRLYRNPFSK